MSVQALHPTQDTQAPPLTRPQPRWVDWGLSLGVLVVLAPLLLLMGLLAMVGAELHE